jgi:crotonobetainyl-CoA:carnitine CoA-transferase CaiB-like acyl-CoA transferase
MAETMLYVNEHAHNQMWTGVEPVGEIRSFQPADYPVLTVADGSMVVVGGHPAERGTFDFFVAAMQQPELLSDPRFSDVATRLEHFDELMDIMKAWAKTVATSDEIENRLSQYQLATGRLRSVGELADTQWAKQWSKSVIAAMAQCASQIVRGTSLAQTRQYKVMLNIAAKITMRSFRKLQD